MEYEESNREKAQDAERSRMQKHGANLAQTYRNSILKRLKRNKTHRANFRKGFKND